MPITYQQMFDRAYGHSTKNQPGSIAEEDPELLQVAKRVFEALYTIGSTINPTYFGTFTTVSNTGGSWDHPAEADTIFGIEVEGDEVVVVPFDEQDAEPGTLAVYALGQAFWPVDGGLSPSTSKDLTIYHTVAPPEPADKTVDVPEAYPENHYDLPILQVAVYLTRKDLGGREAELQALARERNKELGRYVTMLQNRLPEMRSKFRSPQRVKDQSLVSFRELLTGAIGGEG